MSYLFKFIKNSVSYFHTIEQAKQKLAAHGFEQLHEQEEFKLKANGKYYVIRDDSAIIAFIIPAKNEIRKTQILLSHSDSPTFRIKPHGEYQHENMLLWGLETYGGPIYSTWFNRNLGFAGRVFYEQNKKIKSTLVQFDDNPIMMTQLPIHIDRNVNTEGMKVNAQEQLNALVALQEKDLKKQDLPKGLLEDFLKKKLKCSTLLNHELFVYPLEEPRFLGFDRNLFSAPRIDNLASASASLEAFCEFSKKPSSNANLNMIYLASHEEVGSRTFSGADSPFFGSILERIFFHHGLSFEKQQQCLANSSAYSIDGSHALDPKHKDHYEPRHTPLLGNGVTIKVDSSACYAYNAQMVAQLLALTKKHQIKFQTYLKKGDQRQGSTIGPLFTKNLGIKTLDIGLAQLSMHSSYEVGSCRDYDQLVKLLSLILKDQL